MNRGSTKFFALISSLCLLVLACNNRSESAKHIPSDLTGFWKWHCSDAWGVQIKKQTGNLFSVSFCGPGGCFEPGQWMPNTPIVGDPQYRYTNPTTLEIQHGSWQKLTKCTSDTNPVLDYSAMPSESPRTKEQASPSAVSQPSAGKPRQIVLPNPRLIHCKSAECSTLWKQDSANGRAVYPAQVLTDLVNGEIVGLTAVYDKSVSADELRDAVNKDYEKWSLHLHSMSAWRIEPEQLAISLADGADGAKEVIYLKFGTYESHVPSAHIDRKN